MAAKLNKDRTMAIVTGARAFPKLESELEKEIAPPRKFMGAKLVMRDF